MSWHCCWSLAFHCGDQGSISGQSMCDMLRSEWLWNWFLSDYFGVLLVSFILLSQTLYMITAIVRLVKWNTLCNAQLLCQRRSRSTACKAYTKCRTLRHSAISWACCSFVFMRFWVQMLTLILPVQEITWFSLVLQDKYKAITWTEHSHLLLPAFIASNGTKGIWIHVFTDNDSCRGPAGHQEPVSRDVSFRLAEPHRPQRAGWQRQQQGTGLLCGYKCSDPIRGGNLFLIKV